MEKNEKKELLRRILEPEARERLCRVRLVKPEVVEEIENYLLKLFASKKINKKIGEKEIIEILKAFNR
ncbi:MAG: DNA-binding protein [Candidatus Aenigmatarchaeota archaeon]